LLQWSKDGDGRYWDACGTWAVHLTLSTRGWGCQG
jgi:hypothetical protein